MVRLRLSLVKFISQAIIFSYVTSRLFLTWVMGPNIGFWLNPELSPAF